eukprot:2009815-Rhodomonas_salina.1
MTHEPITALARVLQRVLPQQKDMVWVQAWRYNKILAGARWAELLPAHHRDLRLMTWTCQEVISLSDQPDLMYEALIHLAAERLVSVQNKDNGLVITRETDRPFIPDDESSPDSSTRSRRSSAGSLSSLSSLQSASSRGSRSSSTARGPSGPGFIRCRGRYGRRGRGGGYRSDRTYQTGETRLPALVQALALDDAAGAARGALAPAPPPPHP